MKENISTHLHSPQSYEMWRWTASNADAVGSPTVDKERIRRGGQWLGTAVAL